MQLVIIVVVIVLAVAALAWAARRAPTTDSYGVTRKRAGRGLHAMQSAVQAQATFTVRRARSWETAVAAALGDAQPSTGDPHFDRVLRVSAVRQDVHRAVRANSHLRQAMLNVASAHTNLVSVRVRDGQLTATFKGSLGFSRDRYELEQQAVSLLRRPIDAALAGLPADTPSQRRKEQGQVAALALPGAIFAMMLAASVLLHPEVSSDGVPLSMRLLAALPLLVAGPVSALIATKDGRARLHGVLSAFWLVVIYLLIGAPAAVEAFNATRTTGEEQLPAEFERLNEVHHSRGANEYFLHVVLPTGQPAELQVSAARYTQLSAMAPRGGQPVTVVLARGRAGLHWVERLQVR